MANHTSPDQVRNILRAWPSSELTDTLLNDDMFIPLAEAKINAALDKAELTYDDLTTDQKLFYRAAVANMVAIQAIHDGDIWGNDEFSDIVMSAHSVQSKESLERRLARNVKSALSYLGAGGSRIKATSGDDYLNSFEAL